MHKEGKYLASEAIDILEQPKIFRELSKSIEEKSQ